MKKMYEKIETITIRKNSDDEGTKYLAFDNTRGKWVELSYWQDSYSCDDFDGYVQWRSHEIREIDGVKYISANFFHSWRYDRLCRYIVGIIDDNTAVMIVPEAGNYHLETTNNHPKSKAFKYIDWENQIDYKIICKVHKPFTQYTSELTPIDKGDMLVVGFYNEDKDVIILKDGYLYSTPWKKDLPFSYNGSDYFILSSSADIAKEIGNMYKGKLSDTVAFQKNVYTDSRNTCNYTNKVMTISIRQKAIDKVKREAQKRDMSVSKFIEDLIESI